MVGARIRLTYEDYVGLPDDRRYEIIDGELYEMTAPTVRHQVVLLNLGIIFRPYVRKNRLGRIYVAPIDVIFDEDAVVQPDIAFVAESRRGIVREHAIVGAPDLVVEILSPTTAAYDRNRKAALYERYGVSEYWMVDSETETVEILRLSDTGYAPAEIHDCGVISTAIIPGLQIELADIFAQD